MKVSVIGLGYVGLPLALALSKYFHVIGFDKDIERVKNLNKRKDSNNELKLINIKSKIKFTNNQINLSNSDFFIVTVPTPIYKNKEPDLRNIINATKIISKFIKKNNIVIYESTVYPGVTEEICGRIITNYSKLILNKDFFLGYSPERINPGDKNHTLANIKKIVSGSNKFSLNKIYNLYKKIIKTEVIKVDSIKIAEGAKIIENAQRDINIAFMNELKIIFDKINIDFDKVLKAASTKWNFINFKPGLVGGHCIGIDPYYLHYLASKNGLKTKVILSGREINDRMPKYYYLKFKRDYNKYLINTNKQSKKILFLGLTFKKNVSDFRNSKSIEFLKYLKKDFKIDICDPVIDNIKLFYEYNLKLKKLNNLNLNHYSAIIFSVKHDKFKKIEKLLLNKKIFRFDIEK